MDKRFFLTIVLCFLAAWVWMTFIAPPPERPAPSTVPPASTGPQTGSPTPSTTPTVQSAPPSGTEPTAPEAAPKIEPPAFPVESRVLDNELADIEFTSVGATLHRVVLKEYRNDDREELLDLVSPERMSGGAFAIAFDGKTDLPWDIDAAPWELVLQDPASSTLRYRHQLPDGRGIVKTFVLRAEEYMVDVSVEFTGDWASNLSYSLFGPQRLRHDENSRGILNQCVYGIADVNGRFAQVERRKLEKLVAAVPPQPRVAWGGLESNYFAFVIRPIPDSTGLRPDTMVVRQDPRFDPEWAKTAAEQGLQGVPYQVGFFGPVTPGQADDFEVYAGPKERAILGQYDAVGFDELIEYGAILGFLVFVFLITLGFFHSITGSYGIAIVILTVIVKVLLHPINKKNQGVMMRQQKKMAKIQPQMTAIKERHKNDSLKANKEIQKLLKENDVNPAQMFGGCLLMLLQLPIWIALISTFSLAIDLRQESFLYIADLTLPDRLFDFPGGGFWMFQSFNLLPFLYVGLTLISQRMMPRSADPQMQQQQKMMTFMMVAFGFIFYNFSSGLLLYFMTSAALGIVEQKIIRAELKAEGLT